MSRPLDGKYRLMGRAELAARLLNHRLLTASAALDIAAQADAIGAEDLMRDAWRVFDTLEFCDPRIGHKADSDE